jgi:hypothetical protein
MEIVSSNKRTVIGLAALLLLAAWNASAAGHLKITLSQPADKNEAEAGVVTVTFENTGDQPVSMLRWKTPFAIHDDRLANPQFTVLDGLGRDMPYVGRNVKFGGMSPDSFMILEPHQVVSKDIDAGSDHDLKQGPYTLTYTIDLTYRPEMDAPDGTKASSVPVDIQKEARSNELKIWVAPSLRAARKLKTASSGKSAARPHVPRVDPDRQTRIPVSSPSLINPDNAQADPVAVPSTLSVIYWMRHDIDPPDRRAHGAA